MNAATASKTKATKTPAALAAEITAAATAHANAAQRVLAEQVSEAPKNDGPKRGDRVDGGIFIGERNGVKWIAYRESDVEPMTEAFDAGEHAELRDRGITILRGSESACVSYATTFERYRATRAEVPARLSSDEAIVQRHFPRVHQRTPTEGEQLDALLSFRSTSIDGLSRWFSRASIERNIYVHSGILGDGTMDFGGDVPYRRPSKNGARRRAAIDRAIMRSAAVRDFDIPVTRDVRFLRQALHAIRCQIGLVSWVSLLNHFNIRFSINLRRPSHGGTNIHYNGELGVETHAFERGSQEWVNDIAIGAARYIADSIGADFRFADEHYAKFHSMLARGLFNVDAVHADYKNEPLLTFEKREAA